MTVYPSERYCFVWMAAVLFGVVRVWAAGGGWFVVGGSLGWKNVRWGARAPSRWAVNDCVRNVSRQLGSCWAGHGCSSHNLAVLTAYLLSVKLIWQHFAPSPGPTFESTTSRSQTDKQPAGSGQKDRHVQIHTHKHTDKYISKRSLPDC